MTSERYDASTFRRSDGDLNCCGLCSWHDATSKIAAPYAVVANRPRWANCKTALSLALASGPRRQWRSSTSIYAAASYLNFGLRGIYDQVWRLRPRHVAAVRRPSVAGLDMHAARRPELVMGADLALAPEHPLHFDREQIDEGNRVQAHYLGRGARLPASPRIGHVQKPGVLRNGRRSARRTLLRQLPEPKF